MLYGNVTLIILKASFFISKLLYLNKECKILIIAFIGRDDDLINVVLSNMFNVQRSVVMFICEGVRIAEKAAPAYEEGEAEDETIRQVKMFEFVDLNDRFLQSDGPRGPREGRV